MVPKKYYTFLFGLSLASGSLLFINYLGLNNVKDYLNPYQHTETKSETSPTGTVRRLSFQNIDNRVFLLESFRSRQTGDLYILTETEEHNNSSKISDISCIMCKNLYSFYDDPNECSILKLESTHQPKNRPEPLRTTFFRCKIPSHIGAANYSLSTLKIADEYGHLVPISDIDKDKEEKNSTLITMCTGPQYGKTKKALSLAEWIEFNHLMGVSKFQIYVTDKNSVSHEYHNMLKKYVEKGLVDLVYWEALSNSHYYSQISLLNHCVWASKAKSKFVVINDIDEFFVPVNKSYNNWSEAFESYLENTNNSEICFRNWHYDATCPDQQVNSDLMLSSVFIREKEPWPSRWRTKCILRPERVLVAGIHKTLEFMSAQEEDNYTVAVLPPKEGYMAHFTTRIPTPECNLTKVKEKTEINKDLQRYGKLIETKVNNMRNLTK